MLLVFILTNFLHFEFVAKKNVMEIVTRRGEPRIVSDDDIIDEIVPIRPGPKSSRKVKINIVCVKKGEVSVVEPEK